MKIFAISDLHLSTNTNKPMDVFGGNWVGYIDKIIADWEEKVSDEDLVLIGGDISWAMNLDDAIKDIQILSGLKGKKNINKRKSRLLVEWNRQGKRFVAKRFFCTAKRQYSF